MYTENYQSTRESINGKFEASCFTRLGDLEYKYRIR